MSTDKRIGWLAGLNVGDDVVIHSWHYGDLKYQVSTVQKITQTGRIRVLGLSHLFGHDGRGDGRRCLLQATPENRNNAARVRELRRIKLLSRKVSSLSTLVPDNTDVFLLNGCVGTLKQVVSQLEHMIEKRGTT